MVACGFVLRAPLVATMLKGMRAEVMASRA
jgi:hypothetical protein